VISAAGADFPEPPAGYALASVNDIQSFEFVDFYNANGLSSIPASFGSGCCVVAVENGFLLFNGSYVEPFDQNGFSQCMNMPTLSDPVYIGSDTLFVPYLDYDSAMYFAVAATLGPELGCDSAANTFAVYKSGSPQPPPPPAVILLD
jgi:hypothetical protein